MYIEQQIVYLKLLCNNTLIVCRGYKQKTVLNDPDKGDTSKVNYKGK